jgi:hypothetical protein
MAVINAKRSLACNIRLALCTRLPQHAARAPAQSNESDFRWRRSEIAELRPEQRPQGRQPIRDQRPKDPKPGGTAGFAPKSQPKTKNKTTEYTEYIDIEMLIIEIEMSWGPSRGLTLWLRGLRGG